MFLLTWKRLDVYLASSLLINSIYIVFKVLAWKENSRSKKL